MVDGSVLVLALIAGYGILRGGEWLLMKAWRSSRARVIWVDEESRTIRISSHKLEPGGKIEKKGGTWLLEGGARYGGDMPTWVVSANPENGRNYTFPTRAETIDRDKRLAAAMLYNPQSYRKAEIRADWAGPLKANDTVQEIPWTAIGIVAGIAIVLVVGLLLYIVQKLPSGGG